MKRVEHLEKWMKKYTEAEGIPGYEHEVRSLLKEDLKPFGEEFLTDRLGGVVAKKTGDAQGPRILLAGHLDEIGFMVTKITEKGFLRFKPLGGWWAPHALSQRVKVKTRKGDHIGIIASKSIFTMPREERNKGLDLNELFIDVGAKSREEAEEMGIRLGDPVIPVAEFFTMRDGQWWCGKALDNRAGCVLALEVLRRLQQEEHPNVVYAGATAQEEVGTRGAGTLAHVVQPDIAFALDIGSAYDTPGDESYPADAKLDGGPLIFLMDATMIGHVGLRHLIVDTAEELGMDVQLDALMFGGTDGSRFHINGCGCPSVAFGFPIRYAHTHHSVMSRKDFEQAAELLVAVIKKLDRETLEKLIG